MLIKDVLKINKESINPQKYSTDMFYHFSLPAYDNNQTPEFQKGQDILSLKFKITKPCILFNKLNVRFRRIWNIRTVKDNYICSSEFLPLVLNNNNKFLQDYLFYLLTSDKINSLILPDTNGTSSSHQRIDPNMLLDIEIQDVSKELQQHIVNSINSEVKYAC